MNYPLISEYIEAIKAAEDNFDELTNFRAILGDDGQPVMTSGNFAVVFKMKDVKTGKLYALKCFTKEQEGRAEAYHQIAEELKDVDSPYLVSIRFLEKELFVDTEQTDETEFPVLLMDWVEGKTLDKYLRENLDDKYALEMLAYRFSQLAQWLIPQPFAHGDLKPDNILVREDGSLVLVDYDGMYVPTMKGQKARELGSPNFRHPLRTKNDFDEHIDDFTVVSIVMSLKAIAIKPSLFSENGDDDRLLFTEKDYMNFNNSQCTSALQSLMFDNELSTLYGAFVITWANKQLVSISPKILEIGCPFKALNPEKLYKKGLTLYNQKQYDKAFRCFYESAQYGHLSAQFYVGVCYDEGHGVGQNYKKALEWFTKSAERGDVDAQFILGICYAEGHGVEPNDLKAFEWYVKAANQGDESAQCSLAQCYEKGIGTTQSFFKAFEWFSKCAEHGNAEAQFNLGVIYAEGKGVPQNYEKAVEWFTKAANQGAASAQFNLGICYVNGWGVARNYEKAAEWYNKAAKQGDSVAQYNLGFCYEKGRGVPQSYEKAKEWYAKASELGYSDAHERMNFCIQKLIGERDNIEHI